MQRKVKVKKIEDPLSYIDKYDEAWKKNSTSAIRCFLNFIYGIVPQSIKGLKADAIRAIQVENDIMYVNLARQYLSEKRNYFEDLKNWCKSSTYSARTMQLYYSAIKIFLNKNGIALTDEEAKSLYKEFKKGRVAPTDAIEKHQIRSFLEHCDPRMKAIALLLVSTGMRIAEVLALTEDMITPNRRMITLLPEITKTDSGRNVFYNNETEQALNQWLKVRTDYIIRNNEFIKNVPGVNLVDVKDPRIFPLDKPINKAWNNTAKKAGMDKTDGKRKQFIRFHPHAVRKFYSTRLRIAGMPDGIVESLLGHSVPLSMYQNYTPKQFQEQYEKYADVLTIGGAEEIAATVRSITEKAIQQNGEMQKLKDEKEALEARLKVIEVDRQKDMIAMEQASLLPEFKMLINGMQKQIDALQKQVNAKST